LKKSTKNLVDLFFIAIFVVKIRTKIKTIMKTTERKFPNEIATRMLANQIRQGNKADINVFVKYPAAGKLEGGFDWEESPEGYEFWRALFDLF
jgi:hypothetical protein